MDWIDRLWMDEYGLIHARGFVGVAEHYAATQNIMGYTLVEKEQLNNLILWLRKLPDDIRIPLVEELARTRFDDIYSERKLCKMIYCALTGAKEVGGKSRYLPKDGTLKHTNYHEDAPYFALTANKYEREQFMNKIFLASISLYKMLSREKWAVSWENYWRLIKEPNTAAENAIRNREQQLHYSPIYQAAKNLKFSNVQGKTFYNYDAYAKMPDFTMAERENLNTMTLKIRQLPKEKRGKLAWSIKKAISKDIPAIADIVYCALTGATERMGKSQHLMKCKDRRFYQGYNPNAPYFAITTNQESREQFWNECALLAISLKKMIPASLLAFKEQITQDNPAVEENKDFAKRRAELYNRGAYDKAEKAHDKCIEQSASYRKFIDKQRFISFTWKERKMRQWRYKGN